MIGIVGGMGPYAGLDLFRKLCDETVAARDQDHLPVALVSLPGDVPDRTEFLLGRTAHSPTVAILDALRRLELAGARLAGMPCNTAHAAAILQPVHEALRREGRGIRLIDMVQETAAWLADRLPAGARVGVLGTNGTVDFRIYDAHLEARGFEPVYPDPVVQRERVHAAIYEIKATPGGCSPAAQSHADEALLHLAGRGCEAIVLACTELPLVVRRTQVQGRPVVDATRLLARALIREFAPERLRASEPGGASP